ncbi:MAG: cytochrome c3 family protein [bacterium]|nr:cytochrome c3 family protein [bacterium]
MLDEIEDLYEPVKFSHGIHAQMSDLDTGCVVCHHHTPTDAAHPPCKECHSADLVRERLDQPALKGAYHRQCMGCHREWTGATECEVCHAMKAKVQEQGEAYAAPHYRPCKEPAKTVYETGYDEVDFVTFLHGNHSTHYGLACSDCHRADPCIRCHYQGTKPVAEASGGDVHEKCSGCHDSALADECDKCHSPTARDESEQGWVLKAFHQEVACQRCHPAGKPIAKIDNRCDGCHRESSRKWNTDTFDHAVVGLALDEIHGMLDCTDCHPERQFAAAPDCTTCHDDKAYPGEKPGELIKMTNK